MKDSGLSHLSAVSGANCTLIAGAVTMLLRTLRARPPVVLTAVLGTLVIFVLVVGLEPSVIRAAVMGGIGAAAVFFGRGRHALPLLCLAICLLLIWEPTLATEPAFQLSACATAGIVLGGRPVQLWLTEIGSKIMPAPVAGTIGAALAVTVCAQIACQPVLLGISGAISAYAVPANMFAAPLVPFVTVPGTLAAFLLPIAPGFSTVILWCVGWPAAGIGWIAHAVANWPGALHPWPDGVLGGLLIVLHIGAALALLWLVLRWERSPTPRVRRRGTMYPGRVPVRTRWAVRSAWVLICMAVGGQIAVVLPPPVGPVPVDWSLAVCDVGQGDMLLLRTGDRAAMVVDTGPDPALATGCLRDVGVDQIDLMVLSHLHQDHVGGTNAVVDCCSPGGVLYSTATSPRSGIGESTGSSRAPKGAVVAVPGQTGMVGGGQYQVRWTVLAADSTASAENDASIVLHAVQATPSGQFSVLMAGDLEEDAARRLIHSGVLPDHVDVYKASHHGARNGGVELPEALGARLSVVSVGRDNDYGHPHPDIIGALARHGPVIRTDEHGTSVLSVRDGQIVPTVRPPHGVSSTP